ncbi:hypothetical protein AaE_011498, partial [Aphanomyces astaci]
ANPSADEYFEQQKDRFLGLLQHLQAVQSSLKRHASLLTQFVGSASQLGVDIRSVVQGSGENAFSTAMASQEAQMTDARGDTSALEAKAMEARVAMDACTLGLYRVFAKYEADRRSMLHTELDMVTNVLQGLHSMYTKNAAMTAPSSGAPTDVSSSTTKKDEDEVRHANIPHLFNMMRARGQVTKPGACNGTNNGGEE